MRIALAQDRFLSRMPLFNEQSLKRFRTVPFLGMEVSAEGLRYLQSAPEVTTVEEDIAVPPSLAESVSVIGAPAAWSLGLSGAGQTIAILDTGVDKNHPFLAGKVVSEACYSTFSPGLSTSVCAGGVAQLTSTGSGLNCQVSGCEHGTHVAGIAAGRGAGFSGVAKDANIVAIQVFSRIVDQSVCGFEPAPCVRTFSTDQALGLERVLALAGTLQIAAVNMSLGGGKFTSFCDSQQTLRKAVIDNLRSKGIATVISAGNEGFTDSLGSPACISSAISAGSTGDGSEGSTRDRVSDFSNSASFLKLLAPGENVFSSVPGGAFSSARGASMAAPHIAGAVAVLKSKSPSASVDQILSVLTSTGAPSVDFRNGIVKPRIQVDAALNALTGGVGPGEFAAGGLVTLTATPSAGFAFVNWQRDGAHFSTSPSINVTMSASFTMTAVFSRGPAIRSVTPQSAKILIIDGVTFGQAPRVLINGVDRSSFIKTRSASSITLKGKRKKSGLRTGENSIQVIGDGGSASNVFVLTL